MTPTELRTAINAINGPIRVSIGVNGFHGELSSHYHNPLVRGEHLVDVDHATGSDRNPVAISAIVRVQPAP